MGQVRNNKIIKEIDYLNKSGGRIDELMWVFCKNDSVKQKKQVFDVKQTESFKRADVNALRLGCCVYILDYRSPYTPNCKISK